ncbi:MAG: ABC transporter substrate-binding protein, partial [Nocardioidaceae bacterium]
FHPKYNPKVKANDWYTKHDQKANYATNPDCPTMTAWRLTSYKEGRSSLWERNPFYYAVDRAGNQLPFIDTMYWGMVQKEQVMKLQLRQGKVDFTEGRHSKVNLADVEPLTSSKSGQRVWYWDGGSGTGSIFFFNYDYPDEPMRKLIRNSAFRQALSHAYHRENVRKSVYYDTGDLTTGTLSPKGKSFHVNDNAQKIYQKWGSCDVNVARWVCGMGGGR